MRHTYIISICLLLIILTSCTGSPSPAGTREPEIPRREFQSIETGTYPVNEPSIVGNFIAADVSFSAGSINFSTALFLSDIGILPQVSKDLFEKYATALFSQFPDTGEVKQIITPGLSSIQEEGQERDAYFFITKNTNDEGHGYYSIESNIPTASIYAKTYDGYVMNRNRGFYRNKVPARWTSIMRIMTNSNILLYRGVAYPSKSAPLIFTGTGIGSDVRMNAILSDQIPLSDTAASLKSTVEKSLQKTALSSNQQQAESMRFLEKSTYLSMAAYSYIDSNTEESRRYFLLSKQTEALIPNDTMGSRHNELEVIMDYLLNQI